ncbi:hypothetical protein [Gymnodinialimonas sp.]
MTATRPPFSTRDLPATLLLSAIGAFLGFGASILVFLTADGLGMILWLLIPIAIYQIVGIGIVHLIVWACAASWALIRGRDLPPRPPSLPAPHPRGSQPWLKDYAMPIAFAVSLTLIVLNAWRNGIFTEGFL